MNTRQALKRNTGFTLIELLVTLSIFSLLIYAAVPSFSLMIEKQNMETAKNRIIHSLKKAKKIANAENTFVDVTISANTIELAQKNKPTSIIIKIPGRITTESAVTFTFNPMGALYNPDGESIEAVTNIRINPESNPSLLETITISKTGMITASKMGVIASL